MCTHPNSDFVHEKKQSCSFARTFSICFVCENPFPHFQEKPIWKGGTEMWVGRPALPGTLWRCCRCRWHLEVTLGCSTRTLASVTIRSKCPVASCFFACWNSLDRCNVLEEWSDPAGSAWHLFVQCLNCVQVLACFYTFYVAFVAYISDRCLDASLLKGFLDISVTCAFHLDVRTCSCPDGLGWSAEGCW